MAGFLGGLLMALFAMIHSQAIGQGFLMPLRLIAATFVGPDALMASSGIAILGALIHLLVSVLLGVFFSYILSRQLPLASSIAFGLFFAIAVWLFMTYVLVPPLNSTLNARVAAMPGSWLIAHLFYGLGVGLTPLFRRRPRPTVPAAGRTVVP
ncbi:MAG: DUF6789 family protein [Myxococcaceae bacterium]